MLARYLEEPKPVVWNGAFPSARLRGEAPERALPEAYASLLETRDRLYTALAHRTLDGGELEAAPPSAAELLVLAGAP